MAPLKTDPPRASTVLLVDDSEAIRATLRLVLERRGHVVLEAGDQDAAERQLAAGHPDLILADLRLPSGDGLGVLRAAKALDPDLPVIVLTGYGGVNDAVQAIRDGALDFLTKPVDTERLALIVARALRERQLVAENLLLKEQLAARRGAPLIVGGHPALRHVMTALHRAAATEATVLLEGESGTGKELFARAVHALSARAEGPFVAINCAAIPDTLLETELFGHERGAFTGAVARKLGKFEIAHRGTLFLDEIGDLPVALQAKILRALETREVDRVGGDAPVRVSVRIVAATNRDLPASIAARRFREDLYFRLSVVRLAIPPLRDRMSDVPRLARYFVERFCREQTKPMLKLAPASLEALDRYGWPGNVRELQNCIERAVILADGDTILPQHITPAFTVNGGSPDVDPWDLLDLSGTLDEARERLVRELERRKIDGALALARGNRLEASRALGISPAALAARVRDPRVA